MTAPVDAATAARITGPTRTAASDEHGDRQISQLPYLPGLDGIRALAVVAVMVYHANSSWLPGGYLGVEVFFVISGYLITLLLIAEHERTGSTDFRTFWLRRARRLLPALFVMLLLLSTWVSLFETEALGKLRGDIVGGVFYVSNWYQIWIGAGYSAGNDFAPLRHLWSLAVEEQFYLVWPLVMVLLLRKGSRRVTDAARWLFAGALAITVVVAFLIHTGAQQTPELTPGAYWSIGGRAISKPDLLYLSTISRAGGLLLGSGFAMIWRPMALTRGPVRRRGSTLDLAALGGLVVLGVLCWTVGFEPARGVDGFLFRGGLLLTGIATLAVIAAVTHPGARAGKALSGPVLRWVGTRSYGLYLYHWPIYQIIRHIAANRLALHEFVLAMIATGIVTELSYRYVEMPIRAGRLGELVSRIRHRPTTTNGRRLRVSGIVAAGAMSVFVVFSVAAAPLRQNEVQQSIEAGRAATCDTLVDLDCDGNPDVDANGDPIAAQGGGQRTGATVAGAGATANPPGVAPGPAGPPRGLDPSAKPVALGDSVMLGAAPALTENGFTVDAVQSRSWKDGLADVQTLAARDRLPDQLVIHLGTNSEITQSQMDDMMRATAGIAQVVILTVVIPNYPQVQADNNALIERTVPEHPNVQLLDWANLAPQCPGSCFAADGIHLRPDGQTYYAQQLEQILGR